MQETASSRMMKKRFPQVVFIEASKFLNFDQDLIFILRIKNKPVCNRGTGDVEALKRKPFSTVLLCVVENGGFL
jgi:hypothetical protein